MQNVKLTVDEQGWNEVESKVRSSAQVQHGRDVVTVKTEALFKALAVILVVITVLFTANLAWRGGEYHSALVGIADGKYEDALVHLGKADGYRDSEMLEVYCHIMMDYDPSSYASIYRCYHKLDDLIIDNDKLAVEIASKRAEISALYVHLGEVAY